MGQVIAVVLGLGIIALTTPGMVRAADQCPAELAQAKAALKSAQAQAKSQDIQAPRSQAGARSQDIQAPRSQQEPPVPRGQEIQAPRVKQAAALVQQSDAACKKGDMTLSAKKARGALGLLKK